jgi:WbqC-like protein family
LLFDLNLETTKAVMKWLDIDIPVVKESQLGVAGESTLRLANVCKAMGADTYVSGAGGRNYMDEGVFAERGVKLEFQRYEPEPYPQRFVSEFVPNLSILDMLFNVGPDSRKLVGRPAQPDLVK